MKKTKTVRRFLAFLLAFAMLLGNIPAYAADEGSGTAEENVTEISDEAGLRSMSASGNYRLTEDITLTGTWSPIMNFSGTLDGAGHVIRGLNVQASSDTNGVGFFGSTDSGAVIRDLGLEGSVTNEARQWGPAGALVGVISGDTIISGCYTNVTVTAEDAFAGGIAGDVRSVCLIENSYSLGTITGSTEGGIAARLYDGWTETAIVRSCYTTAECVVGRYSSHNETESVNNYCTSSWDDYAELIPEDTDEFLTLLNNGGNAYAAGENGGYPVLSWQIKAEDPAETPVRVYYTLPGEDPQEIREGETVYISPELSGQVQLYFEGVPEEKVSMSAFRYSNDSFWRSGNTLYFDGSSSTVSIQVVVYNSSWQIGEVLFGEFQISLEDPSAEQEPVVRYTDGNGSEKILENGYRFALPLGEQGQFTCQNVEGASGWSSSNPDAASVDGDGRLTAKGAGETVISLTDADGNVIYSYTVEVAEFKVYYTDEYGTKEEITGDSVFTVPTSASGTLVVEGYTPGSGKTMVWEILDEESWNKGVSVSYSGQIYVEAEDTVEIALKGSPDPHLYGEYDFTLFHFYLTAVPNEIEEIRLSINGTEVPDGGSYEAAGSESLALQVTGRYPDSDVFVALRGDTNYTVSGGELLDISILSSGSYAEFTAPGEAGLTIYYGNGKEYTVHLSSLYVPVQEVQLDLPETKGLHILTYAMGYGDNYIGLTQMDLNEALAIVPENASYAKQVQWDSSNPEVGSYESLYNNGVQGHSAGTTTVTASVQDGDQLVSASRDVTFYWLYPIEKLEAEVQELTVQVGEQLSLPIIYTPSQPSQALINWTQEGSGAVSVTRGVNGEYDRYSNTNYYVTGVSEGTVTITGTPAAAAEGTSPSVTFVVHVGTGGEKPELPDTSELVSAWRQSIEQYYEGREQSCQYGSEWNIIALERAGVNAGIEKDAYLTSVIEEIQAVNSDLAPDGKPTDLERTVLALYALGIDAEKITLDDGSTVNLIQWILNSDRISEGSNEAIFALLALDAASAEIPEGSQWNRDSLISEILSYQADDGSFVLTKPISGTGSVDMTAMALQALSRYQDRTEVQASTERALDYLKNRISLGDYGTVESNAQVILALLMLDIDPSDEESGFTAWGANLFTATDDYRAEEGGFAHTTASGTVNEMATQQVLLAVAAWERYAAGTNDIYDMTDVVPGSGSDDDTAYAAIAVEKFSIGQGYLVEPLLVPLENGETTAELLDRVLREQGLTYRNDGSLTDSFYLMWIEDEEGSLTADFPEISLNYAAENGIRITNPRRRATLGEFDYTNGSGWMYSLNDVFPNVGMSDTVPENGDVIRIRFTAMGYGADVCAENEYVTSFVPLVNGDSLTWLLAELNSSENREELLKYDNVRQAYEGAIEALSNIANTQDVIDAAEAELREALEHPEYSEPLPPLPFRDVNPDDWFYHYVYDVYVKGLMTGYGDGILFGPGDSLARAQFALILYRMEGSPEVDSQSVFPDVLESDWYADAINWGVENGIITGYDTTGLFMPARSIQRQELAVMMYRYASAAGYDTSARADFSHYKDADSVDQFAEEAMSWAVASGLISGKYDQTELDPRGFVTRAECAAVLSRFTDTFNK